MIVARVSSCMFGGKTLSHNKEWLQSSIAFAIDGFIGAQKLKKYPEFLKPVAARLIPEVRNIANHYAAAEAAAIPLLEARRRTGEKAMDLLYWMAEQAKGEEQDLKFIAGILLKVSFAAIHTSAAAPAQLIFDLCERPEFVEPLREEVESLVGADGLIDKVGFSKMVKMDSFMKESQRFNPLLLSKSALIPQHLGLWYTSTNRYPRAKKTQSLLNAWFTKQRPCLQVSPSQLTQPSGSQHRL